MRFKIKGNEIQIESLAAFTQKRGEIFIPDVSFGVGNDIAGAERFISFSGRTGHTEGEFDLSCLGITVFPAGKSQTGYAALTGDLSDFFETGSLFDQHFLIGMAPCPVIKTDELIF